MEKRNLLGEYLKARRAQVSPEEVGLPGGGNRRVPGLRREEVATVTGVSADYYARLEQGRERHPSASVLNALSRTLRLGPDAQRYLFAIATPGPNAPRPGNRQIGRNLLELVDEWTGHPTVLIDECHNVLASNQLGRALFGGHEHSGNLARLVFLDVDGPSFYREWNRVAESVVASMRAAASHDMGNSALKTLVGELTGRSAEFRERWAKAEVREKTSDTFLVKHPVVGDLDLAYETLRPNGVPDLLLKVYRAVRGSDSAAGLAVLGSLTVDRPVERVRAADEPVRAAEARARVEAEPCSRGAAGGPGRGSAPVSGGCPERWS